MISGGSEFIAVLLFVCAVVVALEKKSQARVFNFLPAIVIIYFLCMLLSTFGLWDRGAVKDTYSVVKSAILPAMIFLMLLRCDLRKIWRLGPRMLLGFFASSFSIAFGFVLTYSLFQSYYEADTWSSFAALCGSWMGGTGNMVAIQSALEIPDSKMVYALLMDSINYSVWVMLLLLVVPYAKHFNRWVGADTKAIDAVGRELSKVEEQKRKVISFEDLIVLLGLALLVSSFSWRFAALFPQTAFLTKTTWAVLTVTILGVLGALSPLGRLPGSKELSNIMLYTLVALIASRANFAELTEAPLYILSGFSILFIHGAVMVGLAKVFRLDLFTCGVASLANIGGVASAPILAAAYSQVLIPVGVLMAMLGYILGTGGGLLVGKILSLL